MGIVNWIDLPIRADERGSLVVVESGKSLPFEVRRVYYIFGTQSGVSRGFHAHKVLRQAAVCVSGRCRIKLDDGKESVHVWLDSPNKAIKIDQMVWHEMDEFSPECVLLVFADDHYEETDYVRNYEKFLEIVEE